MTYKEKDFSHIIGMSGFSDDLLHMHFTLYAGYVANANALAQQILHTEKGTAAFAELKRRFGWEWNGMRLHELYFGNLSKDGVKSENAPLLTESVARVYGSFEKWEDDFRAVGLMRGIGWVVLAYDKEADTVFNAWINEHDMGHLAGAEPLLVMDVFEHAFITEYGLKRADYIDAFIGNINWSVVEERFRNAYL